MSVDEPIGAAPSEPDQYEWAIVEVYGHRRHAGRVLEVERFGTKMLRIDVPKMRAEAGPAGPVYVTDSWTTHFYGGASIFSMTPTDEDTALRTNRPYVAASRYTLPPPDAPEQPEDDPDEEFFNPDAGSDVE